MSTRISKRKTIKFSAEEYDIPKLGEFPNYRPKTIFTTNNPFRLGFRSFLRLKRRLSAKSEVIYHQEDSRVLSTIVFLAIFIGLLVFLTISIFS